VLLGGDVNVVDGDGDTPLFTVEDIPTARFLVEHGAVVDMQNSEGLSVSFFNLHEDHRPLKLPLGLEAHRAHPGRIPRCCVLSRDPLSPPCLRKHGGFPAAAAFTARPKPRLGASHVLAACGRRRHHAARRDGRTGPRCGAKAACSEDRVGWGRDRVSDDGGARERGEEPCDKWTRRQEAETG
jgi:hypothetical protein